MSLAQIAEKIKNDAEKEAQAIISKAKEEADFIARKAKEERDETEATFNARFEAERPEIFKRRKIVAGLDVAKMNLSAKRKLINDVYTKTLAKLAEMPKEEYLAFCGKLLDEAVSTREEKISVGKNEKYIDGEWLAKYNAEHGTSLTLSETRNDASGGFVLINDRKSVDCSWDMLVKVMREHREFDVVKRLFPGD